MPRVAAWLYAGLTAAVLSLFLLEIPIQVSDSFGNMLKLDASWGELLAGEFTQRAYLRPFLWAELKLVYDLAGEQYFAWFRGVHAAQIAVLVALFVHLARPRTWTDAAVLPLGLAALVGSHTFTGTVIEAFPVNTFMTILICCLSAAALSLAAYRWWHDVAAVMLFVVAALTVESGLLVAVIVVGGALLGAHGVSRRAVALVAVLCAGYFVLRFLFLDIGSPALTERSSGYGFQVLEPQELAARFGENPLVFYAYNVVASLSSVLFAEPRGGVWRFVHGVTLGDIYPPLVVNVLGTTVTTAVIAWYAWRRRAQWLARALDHDDRLVLLFAVVLAANATISFPYAKDVVMSPAGALYALAAYVSVRHLISGIALHALTPRAVFVTSVCMVLVATWAIRDIGTHANLRNAARTVRNEWAFVESWARRQNLRIDEPRAATLLQRLKEDAIIVRPSPPAFPISTSVFDVQ